MARAGYHRSLQQPDSDFLTILLFRPSVKRLSFPTANGKLAARKMNRITERFERLRQERKKGFVVYIGGGDPNLEATHDLALAFDGLAVDVLEIGVPFSDPLADGLVNQLAAQ